MSASALTANTALHASFRAATVGYAAYGGGSSAQSHGVWNDFLTFTPSPGLEPSFVRVSLLFEGFLTAHSDYDYLGGASAAASANLAFRDSFYGGYIGGTSASEQLTYGGGESSNFSRTVTAQFAVSPGTTPRSFHLETQLYGASGIGGGGLFYDSPERWSSSSSSLRYTAIEFLDANQARMNTQLEYSFTNGTVVSAPGAVATPEPVTMTLLGTGLAGIAAARRRRRTNG